MKMRNGYMMRAAGLFCLFLFLCFAAHPQERRIRTSDGVDLYVKVSGKGTPCLYLHGGPGSGSYWFEKFMGAFMEKHFRMIYLDQRGCCRSASPADNDYTMDRMVRDFEEVRAALGIDRWIVMGHSFGGLLQAGYALRHPDVIEGMIMINCTLNWKESFEEGFCPRACELLGITGNKPCANDSVLFIDRYGALIQQLNQNDLMWKIGYASRENYRKMSETFGEIPGWNWGSEEYIVYTPDYWEDFKKSTPGLKMPVLFFYGKNDWSIGPRHDRGVDFPDMMLRGSKVGHMPFLENRSGLLRAVRSFNRKYGF